VFFFRTPDPIQPTWQGPHLNRPTYDIKEGDNDLKPQPVEM